ncbi:hydrogenase iron-sulfur subunit [Candidatus Sumerlaeota bacterium]|nr:hydrogenase iron-sulfur subunit [Candidatus Sumerlaeota bacterium]
MSVPQCADVVVYVCYNCMPQSVRLPRQREQGGFRIQVHEVPCSGKIDAQYLFHAFEGGADAVCVVACPRGECRLAQGNYRAEVRIRAVQRLLSEIGMGPDRIALVHCSPDDAPESIERVVGEALERFAALDESPVAQQ